MRLSALLAAALVAGCQSYDFEKVQPLALAQTTLLERRVGRPFKPNLLLLVDRSGSMDHPAQPGAVATLQAMAVAGGFERLCSADVDCGAGNRCLQGTCEKTFFQARDGAELTQALERIWAALPAPCEYILDAAPTDTQWISVSVDGANHPAGDQTWRYDEGKVRLLGRLCDRVVSSTPDRPADVEIRVLEAL